MQKLVFINGLGSEIDLTSGNFGITNWEGFANTGLNVQMQQVPFEDGGVMLDALLESRELSVTVAIRDDNNLELRYELKRRLISALNPKLGEGTLIYTNDYLSKQIKAVPQIPIFENKNSNDAGTLKASVSFTCPSPYWEDIEETEIAINADEIKTVENNGDIPCQLNIDLFNINGKDISVKNISNNKSIIVNGLYNEVVNINTEVGNKKITEKKYNGEIVYIKPNMVCGCYDTKRNEFVFAGDRIIIKTNDFRKFKVYVTTYNISQIYFFSETNKFIATGQGFTIFSSDAISWSATNINYELRSVIYVNGKYIGNFPSSGDTEIYESVDAETWTSSTVSGIYLTKIIYVKELSLFVALGTAGGIYVRIYTSPDLENWTSKLSLSSGDYSLKDIFYIKDVNIAVVGTYRRGSGQYILRCYYSLDANTWSVANMDEYLVSGNCSISGNKGSGFYVKYGNDIFNSVLGTNWQYIKSMEGSGITYFKELGDFLVFSPLRTVITPAVDITSLNSTIYDFIYDEKTKKYIMLNGHDIYVSEDKNKWDLVYHANWNLKQIIYVKELDKYFVTTQDYDKLYTGSNLENLELKSNETGVPFPKEIKYIPQLKKIFIVGQIGNVIGDENGRISFSTDGENWDGGFTIGGRNPINIYSVAYSDKNNRLVFTGGNNNTYYSDDGGSVLYSYQTMTPYQKILYVKNMEKIFSCKASTEDGSYWLYLNNLELQDFEYSEDNSIFMAFKNNDCYMSFNCQEWLKLNLGLDSLTSITKIKYIKKDKTFYIIGNISNNYCLIELKLEDNANIIDKLNSDSDMTLNLSVGTNNMKISCSEGSIGGVIKYRQKYLGV